MNGRGWLAADSVLAGIDRTERGRALSFGAMQAVYLLWLLGDMVIGKLRVDATWWWVTLLSLPPFLLLYALGLAGPRRLLPWAALAVAILGVVVMQWNYCGGSTYVISYAIGLLGFYQPVRRAYLWMALVMVFFVVSARVLDWPWLVIVLLSLLAIAAGASSLLLQQSRRRNAALRLSQQQVQRLAALAERERIGRDLHDLLGHTLSLVVLKAELARKLAPRDAQAAQREMEELERVARHALAEVRAAVSGMRRGDLAAELASARLMLEASGIGFTVQQGAPAALPAEVESSLALVLREAITNIHRHAQASAAQVVISIEGTDVHMQISDNGRGGVQGHGNGISGMRERMRALGGQLAIDAPPGQGCRLSLRAPLLRHAGAAATVAVEGARSAA